MLNFKIYFWLKYKTTNKNYRKKGLNLIEKFIIYSRRNIIAIKTVILKIPKTWMAKGSKLSEFEKGEITALKRVGKSQREIFKALGCSKTVICNYLKSPNEYGTRKPTDRPEKLSPQFKRRIVCKVKMHKKYWNLFWMLLVILEQLKGI